MGRAAQLLERREEMETIGEALQSAVGGSGAVLLIEGPAGIGKSRLLDWGRKRATALHLETLFGRGGALEQPMAFGVVRQLLEQRVVGAEDAAQIMRGPAVNAAPVLAPGHPGAHDEGIGLDVALHALFWALVNLSERRPVLVAVDDAQWADRATLELLVYISRRLDGLPILVMAAVREGDANPDGHLLAELAAASTVIRPAPLSLDGVTVLARAALGDSATPEIVAACRDVTGGNPFYLVELLASVRSEGGAISTVTVNAVRRCVPSTVARSILLRLGRLPESARRLARATAILGDDVPLRYAAELAGVPAPLAATAADALVRSSILAQVQPLRFEHPIVSAAILSDMPPGTRAVEHHRAARLLADNADGVERAAAHLLESVPAGDAWAADTLCRAGRAALARGAPDAAVRLLRRAVDERPASIGLLTELAGAQVLSGSYEESVTSGQRAVEAAADPAARAKIRLEVIHAVLSLHGPAAAARYLEEAMTDASSGDPELHLVLEAELAAQAFLAGIPHAVLDALPFRGRLPGSTRGERFLLAVWSAWAVGRGEPAATIRALALRAWSGGRLLEDGSTHSLAYYYATWALLVAEATEELATALQQGMADTVGRGSAYGFAGVCWLRGFLAMLTGDLVAAEADERLCVENAVPTLRELAHTALALVLLERGDVAAAGRELQAAGLRPGIPPRYPWGWYARGRVLLAQSRPAEALEDFVALGRRATEFGGFAAGLPWQTQAALALLALGDHTAAQDAAASGLTRAERLGAPIACATALHVVGLAATGDERRHVLQEAEAALADTRARLDLAKVRFDLGVTLLRSGERRLGRERLQAAYDGARRCGARGLARDAYDELRIAGARPRRAMFSGAEALTASERRVAEMAADGLSNREIAQALFLTPKTVENQLGSAYRKLGVSSRRELAAALTGPSAGH